MPVTAHTGSWALPMAHLGRIEDMLIASGEGRIPPRSTYAARILRRHPAHVRSGPAVPQPSPAGEAAMAAGNPFRGLIRGCALVVALAVAFDLVVLVAHPDAVATRSPPFSSAQR